MILRFNLNQRIKNSEKNAPKKQLLIFTSTLLLLFNACSNATEANQQKEATPQNEKPSLGANPVVVGLLTAVEESDFWGRV